MADVELEALVAEIENKETALAGATDANNAAQANAQAAVASAAATLAAQTGAHADLSNAIDDLVTYVESLK